MERQADGSQYSTCSLCISVLVDWMFINPCALQMQGYGMDPAQQAAMMAAAHAAVGAEDWEAQHMEMAGDVMGSKHIKAEADADGGLPGTAAVNMLPSCLNLRMLTCQQAANDQHHLFLRLCLDLQTPVCSAPAKSQLFVHSQVLYH